MKEHVLKRGMALLEVDGWIAGVESLDAMLKFATVELAGHKELNGRLLIVLVGEVNALTAVLEAGRRVAEQYGRVVAHRVIAKPHDSTVEFLQRFLYEQYPTDRTAQSESTE